MPTNLVLADVSLSRFSLFGTTIDLSVSWNHIPHANDTIKRYDARVINRHLETVLSLVSILVTFVFLIQSLFSSSAFSYWIIHQWILHTHKCIRATIHSSNIYSLCTFAVFKSLACTTCLIYLHALKHTELASDIIACVYH